MEDSSIIFKNCNIEYSTGLLLEWFSTIERKLNLLLENNTAFYNLKFNNKKKI